MPLTEDQKKKLDENILPPSQRLHLVSHAEIAEAFARALESLVGGHYSVHIKSWSESSHSILDEKIEMSATIARCWPQADTGEAEKSA
jgi:hypothetical protein